MAKEQDTKARLAQIAGELQAIAQNGLHYAENEYDEARYHRTMSLAAELRKKSHHYPLHGSHRFRIPYAFKVYRGELKEAHFH